MTGMSRSLSREQFRAVSIAQDMVKEGSGEAVLLGKDDGMFQGVRRRHLGAGVFERLCNVEGNQGLILDSENRMPVKSCSVFTGAAKRNLPEAVRPRGRSCPELSIDPHTRNKTR